MRRRLTSGVLCTLVVCAGAQHAVAAQAQAARPDQGTGLIRVAGAGAAEAQRGPQPRDALVSVAANAGGMPPAAAAVAGKPAEAAPAEKRRRRMGPAMLMAALAVMTTIALRRLGAFRL